MTDVGAAYLTVRDLSELDALQDRIRQSAIRADAWIRAQAEPLEMLRAMKFEMVGSHPMNPDRRINFIEQINQTWTFAVAIEATRKLFELHPNVGGFKLAPGAHAALELDIMSETEGLIGAEVFAAVKPENNGKLASDRNKLSGRYETHRYVFFAAPNYPGPKRWPDLERNGIEVWSVTV